MLTTHAWTVKPIWKMMVVTSDLMMDLMVIDVTSLLTSKTVSAPLRFLGPLKVLVGRETTGKSKVGHWKAVSWVDFIPTRSSSNSTDASSMSEKSYSKSVGVVEISDEGLLVSLGQRISSNSWAASKIWTSDKANSFLACSSWSWACYNPSLVDAFSILAAHILLLQQSWRHHQLVAVPSQFHPAGNHFQSFPPIFFQLRNHPRSLGYRVLPGSNIPNIHTN
mmetsp:Transcript_21645/g.39728  ORF Transcript_21645/g.39728 Transcript_21645/m.39728 type:complete len:222 (-) Transcript_21645:424-1089(-)